MDNFSKAIKKGRFTIQEIECHENEINLHMLLRRRYSSIRKFGHELLLGSNSNNSDTLDDIYQKGIPQSKNFLCKILEVKTGKHVLFDKVWESVSKKVQREFTNSLFKFDSLKRESIQLHENENHFAKINIGEDIATIATQEQIFTLSTNSTLLESSFDISSFDNKRIECPFAFTIDQTNSWKNIPLIIPYHLPDLTILNAK